ncbi:LCP family protein [Nocardiopsis alborubida]|uniref:LCP family protein n=1 Tax=Nocardiopsis alborubida TaxID=146802 RepID=A0A7X6RU74_9ACTN|nr:LCP family protein [Nocardiopsis alborubida]NKZ02042.1 LCP family protein [Nocardiopsis alborubida]
MSLGQWVACGTTGLLIAASLTVYAGYRDVLSIDTEEVNTDAWGDRPAQAEGIHNILLLATDERAGEDAEYNVANGVRPDVLVVVSIDVDNGGVTMVNMPRDLLVPMPDCPANGEDPGVAAGTVDQLNHAMTYGGLDCQGNTVETITDIHLDHMVMVDFAGFQDIVQSIGGVEMCVPEPIDDPKAHLTLDAGMQTLNGEQALGLARSRASTEQGSDLNRIENQQRMMGAILRKVTSGEIMSSPATLYDFMGSVTDSLVTDDGFTVDQMTELAIAMREVDLGRMRMVTAPVLEAPSNANKLVLNEGPAQELFSAVASGEALPEEEGGDGGGEGSEEAEETAVEPADVSVRVLNGTGITGLASQVGTLLTEQGFNVTGEGDPVERVPEATTIYHGPDQLAQAEELASALSVARLEEVPGFGEELELVMIAQDWDGLATSGGGSGGEGGEGDALAGLDASTAAEDEVSCE